MAENPAADFGGLISREQAENKLREALNLFVGRGRRYSVDQLAKGSGVPKRLIECFKSYPFGHPDHRPLHFGHILSITAFLRAEFTTEWLGLAAQGALDLPDEDPDPGELAVENSDDNATVVRAAVDGHFCTDERRELKTVGSRMMSRGAHLVALGGVKAA